jgi:hypothetical protein
MPGGRKTNSVHKKPLYKNAVTGSMGRIPKMQKPKGQGYSESKNSRFLKTRRESKPNAGGPLAHRTMGGTESKGIKASRLHPDAYQRRT